MSFIFSEYTTSQRKQYINSKQIYEYYIEKKNEYLMNFNLSMYWRESAGKKYLTKKHSFSNRVTSLGVKSEETIKIYDDFVQHKKILKEPKLLVKSQFLMLRRELKKSINTIG